MRLAFGNMYCKLNIFNLATQVGDDGEIQEVSCIKSLMENYM